MTPTPRRRTVTLTGRPPVSIDEREWPVIGSARFQDRTSRGHLCPDCLCLCLVLDPDLRLHPYLLLDLLPLREAPAGT
jgi:hypothetical protein